MEFNGKIIWSADGLSSEQILSLARHPKYPHEHLAIKLDRLFFTKYRDLEIIKTLQDGCGVAIFVDAKIIEIPSKARAIAKEYLQFRPWMLNVMAGACNNWLGVDSLNELNQLDFLAQFADDCDKAGTLSCAVTVLTSKTPSAVQNEYGMSAAQMVRKYAELMKECEMTDIVCSAQEIDAVKDLGLSINTPGIRLPDSSADDQSRIMTPASAIAHGANRLVMGRDIYRGNPADITIAHINEGVQKILANIDEGQAS